MADEFDQYRRGGATTYSAPTPHNDEFAQFARGMSPSTPSPTKQEPSWASQFGTSFKAGAQDIIPSMDRFVQHPIDVTLESLKNLPAFIGGLESGDPETWGALASQAPLALIPGVRALPEGIVTDAGTMAGRALKEGAKAAVAPTSIRLKGLPIELPQIPASLSGMMVGGEAGHLIPGMGEFGPAIGAGIGGLAPIIRGMVTGGRDAIAEIRKQRLQDATPRYQAPYPTSAEASPQPPTASSIPSSLPSGRKVGKPAIDSKTGDILYGRNSEQFTGSVPISVNHAPLPKPPEGLSTINEATNRAQVAKGIAKAFDDNGITAEHIEALKTHDPDAHSLFWNNTGRFATETGISTQDHYVPSQKTIDAVMDILRSKKIK